MSEVLKEDLNGIVSDSNIPWGELDTRRVLITGATGLIGCAIVRALHTAREKHRLNLRLIVCGRNKEKGEQLAANYGAEFVCGDIRDPELFSHINRDIDFIFHCAAITKSAEMAANPADVMIAAADGTRNILELARKKNCKSIVYLSSMEVYGQNLNCEVTESDLGYLDLSNPRSCYPESKRFCEMLCVSYAKQFNLPVKIARLAQTFGAGTPNDDTRVFAQFARSATNGDDIMLHTDGKSRGNYCYTADAVRGLLTLLLKGGNGEFYNISNPAASMIIREMAELVAKVIGGGRIKVVVDIPKNIEKHGYAPTVGYILNADKMLALGWQPKYGLGDMYERMAEDWLN